MRPRAGRGLSGAGGREGGREGRDRIVERSGAVSRRGPAGLWRNGGVIHGLAKGETDPVPPEADPPSSTDVFLPLLSLTETPFWAQTKLKSA